MKFKDFVFSNSKKIIGSALLLSLMAVQTVGATGGITDSLKSKGNIEYDANGDGQADVYFYSKDLTTIAGGVEDINSNMAILSQSFTDLTTASNGYKSDIIAGLNSNVYAKNNIPADSTFEDIISKINNIPAPTTATGNVWSSGDNSGIGITSNGQSVNIDGVTSLNLAVNESVTLPSGYYPNDITISNNVANRGSSPVYLTSANNTVTLPQGYYDEFIVSTNIKTEGEVYYHHHVHSELSTNEYYEDQSPAITSVGPADNDKASQNSGCFTKPVYGTKSCGGTYHLKYTNQEGYPEYTQYHSTCDRCGYSTSDDWNQDGTKCKRTVTDYNNIVGYTTGCGIIRGTVVEALIKY